MIGSLMSRMEDAQKLSIEQLQKSIQDGVLPAYIGIPLLQDKIKQAKAAQAPQQQPQQPPIAQQVLEQAKQIESGIIPQQPMPPQPQMAQAPQQPPQMAQQMPQGIDNAESNLPTEMAQGGIVGFAGGTLIDDEDDDIDPTAGFRQASKLFAKDPMEQRRESASILGMDDAIRPRLSSFTQPISDFASGIKNKFINKTPEVDIVTKPELKPEGGIPGIIASKAQKYNLPPQLMSNIAKAESNFNPNAGNKTGSSAKGLYQFIDKTWTGMGGKPGEQFDPEQNSELGARYIRQNAEFLKNKLGRDPSYSEVYAAHYFGPSGASNLLTRANPKDSIEKGLGTFNDPKGVKLIMKQNPNLRGKTVGQVLNDLERKTGSGIVSLAEGGAIKHFQVGNLVTDDYRKNYDRIFKNKAAQANLTNPAGISSLKAPLSLFPVSAAGMQPPMLGANPAPAVTSSIIPNFDPKTATNRPGTSYTPVGAKPPVNLNKLIKSGGDSNTLMGVDDAKYYLSLQEKAQQFPDDPTFKEEMDKLVKKNPNVLNDIKSLKPTSSLLGPVNDVNKAQLENANRLREIKTGANNPVNNVPKIKVDPNFAEVDDKEMAGEKFEYGGNGADFGPTREEMEPIPKKAEEKNAFDTFLEEMQNRRAEIKGKKEEDKYMSLLAAGLGMMSGTSQFAGANIGKGALAGVQDYRDTQKQRAAELAAVEKEIGAGLHRKDVGEYYKSGILSKDEKNLLAKQGYELNVQKEKNSVIDKLRDDYQKRYAAIDAALLKQFNVLGVNDPKYAATRNQLLSNDKLLLSYENQMRKLGILPEQDVQSSAGNPSSANQNWKRIPN